MAFLDTSIATTTTVPAHAVYVSDQVHAEIDFTLVEFLRCDRLTRRTNGYDEARLSFEIGDVNQIGSALRDNYAPLNLTGKYVRVVVDPGGANEWSWVGYCAWPSVTREGVRDVLGNKTLMGKSQRFTAVGLEYFLDRVQVDSAIIFKDVESPTTEDPDYLRIARALAFNGGIGGTVDNNTAQRGNRHPDETVLAGIHAFGDWSVTPALWTADQIAAHLLAFHAPAGADETPLPVAYTLGAADAAIVAGLTPALDPAGKTVFACLNELFAATRGLVWWLDFVEPGLPTAPHAVVRVATTATAAITLPTSGTFPANADPIELDFDTQLDVTDVLQEIQSSRRYHQVIVRGARMTSTCTLGDDGHTLEVDWTDANETAYKAAASGTTGYGSLAPAEQQARNDAFRRSELFARVYSAFKLPRTWDGKTGDGLTSETRNFALPELSPTGSILGSLPFSVAGLRLLNHTRLRQGWNYADADNPEIETPAGQEAEYMPSFVILKVATSPAEKYQFADKLGDADFAEGTPVHDGELTSYHLHMQQTMPGFRLSAAGGLNHTLAGGLWETLPAAEPTGTEPELTILDSIRCTTCIEADAYCEARWPLDGDLPGETPIERLTIYAGEEYRLDFLAALTVVGLDNGAPVLADAATLLRDDRRALQDIARTAHEWYALDRQPLTLTFRQLRPLFRLGMLVTTIGAGTAQETVNTVVSTITFDFIEATLTVQTHDDDLDVGQLVS